MSGLIAALPGAMAAAAAAPVAIPEALAERLKDCTSCHGEDGNGIKASYPFINWQNVKYLEDQMLGFQAGTQPTNVPKHVPKSITPAEVKAIAKFYGEQKPARDKMVFDEAKAAIGKQVFEERCMECHLDSGREAKQDEPTLAGQPAEYLFTQEKWYASGKRKYSFKADVAHKGMNDAAREAVSHFMASQDIKPAVSTKRRRR